MIADHVDVKVPSVATESEEPLQRTEEVASPPPVKESKLTRYALVRGLARLRRKTRIWPPVEFFAYIEEMTLSEITEMWERERARQQYIELGYAEQRKKAAAAEITAEFAARMAARETMFR